MTVTFRLTSRDLEQAQRLMRSIKPLEAWLFRLILPAFVLAAALGLGLVSRGHRLWGELWIAAFALLTFLVLWMPRYQARLALKKFPYLRDEIEVEFSDAGLAIRTSGARADVPWAVFQAARENRDIVLLQRVDGHVQILPKRAFTAEQLANLQAMFERATSAPAG